MSVDLVDVLVRLFVIERAGVVEAAAKYMGKLQSFVPCLSEPQASGQSLEVLARVARIRLGVEQVGAGVDGGAILSAPFPAFISTSGTTLMYRSAA